MLSFHLPSVELTMSGLPSVNGAISGVIAAKQAAVHNQVDYAVAGKQLDAAAQQGEAAVALLDAAAKLSKAAGLGNQFDAQG
jgi:hypothetical protein